MKDLFGRTIEKGDVVAFNKYEDGFNTLISGVVFDFSNISESITIKYEVNGEEFTSFKDAKQVVKA